MTSVSGSKSFFSTIRSWFQPRKAAPQPKPQTTTPTTVKPLDVFAPGGPGNQTTKVDGRSALDALAQAQKLLRGESGSQATRQGAVVTRDAADVNVSGDLQERGARHLEAESQLKANAGLEAKMLECYGANDQTQYRALQTQLSGDPVAQLALQTLLFSGRLTGKKALTGGETALAGLARLSTQQLAEGLDRKQLLGDLVQELACPEAINQRDRGTCAATTVAVYLANANPAEYVRLVAGLAGPEGTVRTASGKVAAREAGTNVEDGTNRSVSQRLMAPAFMEIANGRFDYDNKDDKHYSGSKEKGSGLSAGQVDVLLEAVFDKSFAYAQNLDKASQREHDAAWDLIKTELKQGEQLPVGLIWNEVTSGDGGTVTHTGHKVLVTGITARDGQEFVVYTNPWGRTEEMPKAEFMSRLRNINYSPR